MRIDLSNKIAKAFGVDEKLVKITEIRGQRDICQTAFDLLPMTDALLLCVELDTVEITDDDVKSLDLGFDHIDIEYSDRMGDEHEMPAVEAWERRRLAKIEEAKAAETEGDKKVIADVVEAKAVKTLRIHDLANDTIYDISSPEHARDETDRIAAELAEEHGTIITLGKVVVEHLPSKYPEHTLIDYYKGPPSKGEAIPPRPVEDIPDWAKEKRGQGYH